MTRKQSKELLSLLKQLEAQGYTKAYIERALELPFGSLSRWESKKKCSSVEFALLKVITTFPWMLKVADERFTPNAASGLMVQHVGKLIYAGAFEPK